MELEEFSKIYKIGTEDFWGLGDEEDFECVEPESIYEQDRWHTYYEAVFKATDGRFWNVSWAQGSTEYQECDPNWMFQEVEPVEVVTTIYKAKQ